MSYDSERKREIDREVAQYEAGGMLPFLAVLAVIVTGLVIYQFAAHDGTTQTAANAPSTMQKIAPPGAPPAPAETTGSGAVRR